MLGGASVLASRLVSSLHPPQCYGGRVAPPNSTTIQSSGFMKTGGFHLSRRRFLRGVGVAMALPWLESIPVWGAAPAKDGTPGPFPRRFAALFMGYGIKWQHWGAAGSGSDMETGKSLQPMEPPKPKMNFITGLFNKHATGV